MELALQIPRLPRRTNRWLVMVGTALGGAALGAAFAYWLDPIHGARRRAGAQQRATRAAKVSLEGLSVAGRDLAFRTRGLWAQARGSLSELRARIRGEAMPDLVIAERARARLGRLCAHPSSIQVEACGGRVRLSGPVYRAEMNQLLRGISNVRGVLAVENALEAHEPGEVVLGLQGAGPRQERPELLQEHWSPSARLLGALAGAGLLGAGVVRRRALGGGASVLGLALLLRALTNLPTARLLGLGAGRRAIDFRKDLHIEAPVEEVFSLFKRFEEFPRFMRHVREVVPHGQHPQRWRWSVAGPAGISVSWDAELTEYVPNQLIAWKSVEGSVEQAGVARFEPEGNGTRLSLRLSYNPPGGAMGHALSSALGAHPKRQLDNDLLRFKSLIERGKARGLEGSVEKGELLPESKPPA